MIVSDWNQRSSSGHHAGNACGAVKKVNKWQEEASGDLHKSAIQFESALFNFQSLLTVVLLLICTCTYIRGLAPRMLDKNKEGLLGIFWKCARIGERKSPYVAVCCIAMAISILFFT